jgi:putative ABC transport system permease protein
MHFFFSSIVLAFQSLWRHKGRTMLTSLGILIGIASVIMVVSIGGGAQSVILNQVRSIGSNLISVIPGGQIENGPPVAAFGITITTLTLEDVEAVSEIDHVVAVNPYAKGNSQIIFGGETMDTFYNGVSSDYMTVEDAGLGEGRFFNRLEDVAGDRVIVLGAEVADTLFGNSDPLGKDVRLDGKNFTVIGVLEARGVTGLQNRDDQVFIPFLVAQRELLGIHHVSLMRIKIDDAANIETVIADATELLRLRHRIDPGEENDFTIESLDNAVNMLGTITDVLRFFLASIAAVSLIIGGIGIMNILLISVTERTREIGLRKALGAPPSMILQQFLMEAVVVTLAGGAAGVVVGTAVSLAVALGAQHLGYDWDFVFSIPAIVVAFGVSAFIGIVFGYYPARKAARLNPIEALRYE